VKAAQRGLHVDEFRATGRFSSDFEVGYEFRMRSLNSLVEQGFISIRGDRLVLGNLSPAPWLLDGLATGTTEAWEICDSYPRVARKFSPDEVSLSLIGFQGEEFVMSRIQEALPYRLHQGIKHVSLTDDTAGYDISFLGSTGRERQHWEVKTTSRSSENFNFFLSRNEWNSARVIPNWYLVLILKNSEGHTVFGHLDGLSLVSYFPLDSHPRFRWSVTKGALEPDEVFTGLPPI
jgi:hypothetical protein